ncbi:MAG: FAD:protein FMN transferase [Planctomycetaceae bacterium]|jgi:thiamine biosynthesis lipoprotein|nr:FAD:protein FMN transferase [Planctomycetaceae bacterium]
MSDKSRVFFERFRLKLLFGFIGLVVLVVFGFIFHIFGNRSAEYVDQQVEGTTMGTIYSIRVHNFPKHEDWDNFVLEIQKRLDQVEQKMSLFKSDSEISRFNMSESLDWIPVSSDVAEIVRVAIEVSNISGGAFDITVAPIVEFWGFGVERKRRSVDEIKREIDKVKSNIGYDKLEVQLNPPALKKSVPELKIDLSAIAKGYAVDVVSRFCAESGLGNYMIEIGGEIGCRGNKGAGNDWRVGIESPVIIPRGDWGGIYQVVVIGNQCMATSGGNRNFHVIEGRYYSHLIDPRTSLPCQSYDENDLVTEEQLGSVSVLDKNCTRADALATALFVLGVTEGVKFANEHGIQASFLVRKNNKIHEIVSDSFYNSAKKLQSR